MVSVNNRHTSRVVSSIFEATHAGEHHGRWRGHAVVPINERSRQTGGGARREIPAGRYSNQQLSELRAALDLRAHPVQYHVVTSTYASELQVLQFLAQLRRYFGGTTNPRRCAMAPRDRGRGSAEYALFPRAPIRLLPD